MKQTITVKQLQELTEEQKERLRSWWEPELYQSMVNRYGVKFYLESLDEGYLREIRNCLPLLSVGQCIELLEEKDPGSWSICCSKSGGWYITSSNLYAPKYYIADGGKDFEEIIDALWQAVKEVL